MRGFLTFPEPGERKWLYPADGIHFLCMWRSRPIQYAQNHFFTGPDWLAEENTLYYTTYFSEGNSINASEISREQAEKEMMTFSKLSQTYSNLDSRTILESKAYEWCRKFEASYPQEMKVYYEDENFCCYIIRQNTYRLYQFGGIMSGR